MSVSVVNKSTGDLIYTAGNVDQAKIGNLSSLTTTDKTSLVGAINELKNGLTNYSFTYSITTHDTWIATSINDMTDYAGKVIYGYMTDSTLGRTYTFAIPVNNMPEIQSPIWIKHDVSDVGNSNSIFVAKANNTNEFCVYLGSDIPDMTLYLFVH